MSDLHKLDNYTQRSPLELEKQIPRTISTGLISTLAAPVLLRSGDEKVLLVGDFGMNKFKLPDIRVDNCDTLESFDMLQRINRLVSFAFLACEPVKDFEYTGLIRHKPDQRLLLTPVSVDISEDSRSAQVQPNVRWLQLANRNADHNWMSEDDINALITDTDQTLVTKNTLQIVQFYIDKRPLSSSQ